MTRNIPILQRCDRDWTVVVNHDIHDVGCGTEHHHSGNGLLSEQRAAGAAEWHQHVMSGRLGWLRTLTGLLGANPTVKIPKEIHLSDPLVNVLTDFANWTITIFWMGKSAINGPYMDHN